MWFAPRATTRRILESEAKPSWTAVVSLATFSSALAGVQLDETGAFSASRSMMPVLIGALQTVFGVVVGPFLMAIVGGWFGGEADPSDLRHAVAWSYIPVAASSVLWIPIWLLMIGAGVAANDGENLIGPALVSMALITVVLSFLWAVALFIGALAAAQNFSLFKATLYVLVMSLPVLILPALR